MRLCLVALCLTALNATAVCENPGSGQSVGVISNSRVKENSGMDFSHKHKDLFWTHNDANNDATVFAIGLDGQTKGEFLIQDAENIDWEDISVASCIHNPGKDCIYLADIGNNKGKRNEFQVYVIEEPSNLDQDTLSVARTVSFSAPDKQNFESFSVDEKNYSFYLISKWTKKISEGEKASILYKLAPGAEALTKLATFDFKTFRTELAKDDMIVTSGDYDSESQTLLVGTYGKAFEIRLADVQQFSSKAKVIEMPLQEKSEAIAYYYNSGETSVVTSSEGMNQRLYSISCQ